MTASTAVAVAVTFSWIGLVTGISFLEAPLKFRAPGVTLQLGLGIGRIVFRALNGVEVVLAAVVVVTLILGAGDAVTTSGLAAAVAALAAQLLLVRPRLSRRSDAILAGEDAPRSTAHHAYIGLEVVKLAALLIGGIAALAAG